MKIKFASKKLLILTIVISSITSCVSRKNVTYFQELEEIEEINEYSSGNNIKIKPDDILTIRVSAPEQIAALPFNLTKSIAGPDMTQGQVELETYLVSDEGTIEFPVIGTVEVEGYTNIELAAKIKSQIVDYVKDPIVNVRILNFQVSVLGEVNNPGMFQIEDDNLSLSKAIALAGDLTIFGKRDNILLIREDNGIKSYTRLDITDASVLNSPQYNLRQNDVIYVEPRGSRRQNAGSLGIASTYISIASVITSIIILVTSNN